MSSFKTFAKEPESEDQWQRIVLTVDSRSRNLTTDTPSKYVVDLPTPIANVKKVRLLSTEITNSQYTVNANNNKIDLVDVTGGNIVYAVTLTPGTYTATDLATEINLRMNAALGALPNVIFTVTYNTVTSKLAITRVDVPGNTFSLLFATGANYTKSARVVMGFNATDLVAVTAATSSNIVNLSGESWVYMKIRGLGSITTIENLSDIFAKVIWNVPPRYVCYDSFQSNPIYFNPSLSFLRRLDVEFRQADGTLYDFNNVEHSYTLEIFTL